jgi:hypothetical protein
VRDRRSDVMGDGALGVMEHFNGAAGDVHIERGSARA